MQIAPSPAACTAQGKDFFNGQCVDKCAQGQQHNPPNGACGPIPASAQTCAIPLPIWPAPMMPIRCTFMIMCLCFGGALPPSVLRG